MTINVNNAALDHARQLIKDASIARDTREDWSQHAPDTGQENAYIDKPGYSDGTWASTARNPTTRRDVTAFRSGTSGGYTVAQFLPSRAEQPSTTTTTSPPQRSHCSTNSTRTNGHRTPAVPVKPFQWEDAQMSEKRGGPPQDHGPHQHAHAAPTTQQIRTVGQRRRQAEEKLEHHLNEARHKNEQFHGPLQVPEKENVAGDSSER